jgi:large repetitive protein
MSDPLPWYSQDNPAVASSGDDYLVAWEEDRSGSRSNSDIYATRVQADGTVLDPSGIPVATSAGTQTNPAIASGGDGYLVAYRCDGGACARWLNLDGTFGNRTEIRIVESQSGWGENCPVVAYGLGVYLVVWTGNDLAGYKIYGARLDPTGALLDPAPLVISESPGVGIGDPALAFDGANFPLLWTGSSLAGPLDSSAFIKTDIRFTRVSPSGYVQDPDGLAISEALPLKSNLAMASDGRRGLMGIFSRYDPADSFRSYRVRGRRITE